MTALDTTALQQRREEVINRHMEAELQHDIGATIGTFAHPRYQLNGVAAATEQVYQVDSSASRNCGNGRSHRSCHQFSPYSNCERAVRQLHASP
jgi:hypothetical protein